MKYETINGWTKEMMRAQIWARNNGRKAAVPGALYCAYKTADGNHCAVGCFIPEDHGALQSVASVRYLLQRFKDLERVLPLSVAGMSDLQNTHDTAPRYLDMRDFLCKWIDENVVDNENNAT